MTAGNNGASTPEDDDPFGYLYEDGQAAGAVPPPGGGGYGYPGPSAGGRPGVPRTSYNQVRTVGERQYGQQQAPQQAPPPQQPYDQPQQAYGQTQQYGQQDYGQTQQYGQPSPQYAAPEVYPGGPPQPPPEQYSSGSGGGRSGPQHKGLLIGAVAVVAVVVIGIAAALMTSGGDKNNDAKSGASGGSGGGRSAAQSVKPSDTPSESAPADLPKQDAATLTLGGAATTSKDVAGAKAAGGAYVVIAQPGDSATWTVDVPKAGDYTLSINYGVPGTDAKTSLTVNDAAKPASVNMKNFAQAPAGDASKGWTNTFNYVNLKKGSNTIKISCEQGDTCGVNLDQLELKAGHQG
ncbi:CBM35 domain-containing protein [Streptomyces sp. NPDC051320]|uniref:CBM35 domain-containing protein n=1 Tax=Streptomyces sp. NPDC051320 TaxID=3154644 RepID=UPI00344272A5